MPANARREKWCRGTAPATQDRTVRLWDLRTNVCQGVAHVPGVPCGAFDEQGLVFCIGTDSGVLKLYDVRSFEKGPFDTFTVRATLMRGPGILDRKALSGGAPLLP
jgi:WD40 repeat protein